MTHRSSLIVTPTAAALFPSPNINVRPHHLSSSNGSALFVSITTFGRNLRRSQESTPRPDSRATECTVPRLITEIGASSKMPCLRFINSRSLPYRLESSSRSSSLRSSYSFPSGVQTCVGSSSPFLLLALLSRQNGL